MNKIIRALTDKDYRFLVECKFHLHDNMADDEYLRRVFKGRVGYSLNLDNPQTFNEKLQWLKLYDRNPAYVTMVDKYEAKKYVASIIGDEYIIPTYGVWDRFDDIDFDKLPNQFVLKTTHDSGGVVVVSNKKNLDKRSARKKITASLKRNYFYVGREWPYKNVRPRIIAEKYMSDNEESKELSDYKLMCFNGKVKCSFTCTDRFNNKGLKVTFYDTDWKVMPFERHYPQSDTPLKKPLQYEEMVELAEKLAKDIPFVRVDFYEVKKQIYFGEMTFYPGSGFEEFTPSEWDKTLGSWIPIGGARTISLSEVI